MKLRNKKTGEIIEVLAKVNFVKKSDNFMDNEVNVFNSLAELNEEWEDYEKPKEFWFVDSVGEVQDTTYITDYDKTNLRNFGNYFETREEAEKAAEKLRAWKRLKDGGFKFKDFARLNDQAHIIRATSDESWTNLYDDLELLFGGKEWNSLKRNLNIRINLKNV